MGRKKAWIRIDDPDASSIVEKRDDGSYSPAFHKLAPRSRSLAHMGPSISVCIESGGVSKVIGTYKLVFDDNLKPELADMQPEVPDILLEASEVQEESKYKDQDGKTK